MDPLLLSCPVCGLSLAEYNAISSRQPDRNYRLHWSYCPPLSLVRLFLIEAK